MREKDINMQIKTYNHLLEHEATRAKVVAQENSGMRVTEKFEPKKNDKIRTVMFPFKDDPRAISKYGAKSDDIAYRIFDLRFEYTSPMLTEVLTPLTRQEVKARKRMLNTVIDTLKKETERDREPRSWNPGGSKVIQRKNPNLEKFQKLAKKKYSKMIQRQNFQKRSAELHRKDEVFNKKMGYFRKANVYYAKELYKPAFREIVEAVSLVKAELEHDEEEKVKKDRQWLKKLNLPPGMYRLEVVMTCF